jgi:phage FluMu protein Com
MKITTGDTMVTKVDADGYLTKCPKCGLGRGHTELRCHRCNTQLLPGYQLDTPQRYECVDCCGAVFKVDDGTYKCGWCRRVHAEDELMAYMGEEDTDASS